MDLDNILEQIGEFGRFQIHNYLLVCLPVIFSAANSLTYVFTASIPKYRCFVPYCETTDNIIYDADWVPYAVPPNKITRSSTIFEPDQCYYYKQKPDVSTCEPNSFLNDTIRCHRWVFDPNERSIVNDWLITCPENEPKLALVGTMHFAGIAFGTVVSGFLADRFGRKIIFIFSILLMAITGVLQTISPDLVWFYFFMFVNSIGTAGCYPLAFILGVEMVGKSNREVASMGLNYFYACGEAFVGLIAWLSRDWVILQLAASVPPLLFVSYYWFLPESPRWLIAKGRICEANAILSKAARVNGKTFTAFEPIPQDSDTSDSSIVVPVVQKKEIYATLKELLRSRVMVVRALVLFYNWSANAFVYYGFSLSAVNLSGNKYLNFILVSLVAIPGYATAQYTMNKVGRKASMSCFMMVCGIMCCAGAYLNDVEKPWISICLYLVGKLSITASFGIIYCYTTEMLPTIIRSGGCGALSTSARFAALLAPFVPLLEHIDMSLPLTLFGNIAFVGGILTLLLPETLNSKLPETVEDAENLGKKNVTNVSNTTQATD
ncbi:organic cation transporter protein-like [Culicoides brevitarsis]|uniref:organic cation transporter protein-like n=1 Tax=Culicoides brevitarsis TaxID=469753 RepID=UPI00307C48B8